jgi:hypothetical protein
MSYVQLAPGGKKTKVAPGRSFRRRQSRVILMASATPPSFSFSILPRQSASHVVCCLLPFGPFREAAVPRTYYELCPCPRNPLQMKKKERSKILGEFAIPAPEQMLSLAQPIKPSAAAPAALSAPVSDDEDIFDDAGRNYVCDVEQGKAVAPKKSGLLRYFLTPFSPSYPVPFLSCPCNRFHLP